MLKIDLEKIRIITFTTVAWETPDWQLHWVDKAAGVAELRPLSKGSSIKFVDDNGGIFDVDYDAREDRSYVITIVEGNVAYLPPDPASIELVKP
jgi:hypothetical protein